MFWFVCFDARFGVWLVRLDVDFAVGFVAQVSRERF